MDETVDIARPRLASLVAKQSQGKPTDPLWTFTMAGVKRAFNSAATSLDRGGCSPCCTWRGTAAPRSIGSRGGSRCWRSSAAAGGGSPPRSDAARSAGWPRRCGRR
eukprot:5912400-Pyramimonas_sp.AAC.1